MYIEMKWPKLSKTILENKQTIGRFIQPDFKAYFNATLSNHCGRSKIYVIKKWRVSGMKKGISLQFLKPIK